MAFILRMPMAKIEEKLLKNTHTKSAKMSSVRIASCIMHENHGSPHKEKLNICIFHHFVSVCVFVSHTTLFASAYYNFIIVPKEQTAKVTFKRKYLPTLFAQTQSAT